ncbi:MAG: DUF2188 domain-containing protein [Candidatus Atribacteria bacterium]|nr:DUF2188 domain-containing protein [Candidatus Atribacteria bacterium]
MKRNILHVVPHEKKGWRINMPEKGDKIFATKKEAVKEAISIARTSQPSQLVIHGRDGKIQEERTYGRDPYPPRG